MRSEADTSSEVIARFALRTIVLLAFAAFAGVGFQKSLTALLWMSAIISVIYALLPSGASFHWPTPLIIGMKLRPISPRAAFWPASAKLRPFEPMAPICGSYDIGAPSLSNSNPAPAILGARNIRFAPWTIISKHSH